MSVPEAVGPSAESDRVGEGLCADPIGITEGSDAVATGAVGATAGAVTGAAGAVGGVGPRGVRRGNGDTASSVAKESPAPSGAVGAPPRTSPGAAGAVGGVDPHRSNDGS